MSKEIRQLAAIMFADMVGYTAMMQDNEQHAKTLRDRYRAVLEASILEFHGIVLQHYGDGTLMMFGSAVDAVRSARRIQQGLQEDPQVPLRIGIHVGDIAYDEEGIYGDSVNIASRIESLSTPGSVLFSEKVQDELRNHPEFPVRPLGAFRLKNVAKPIELFALADEGLAVPETQQLQSPKAVSVRSVAVLPFVNMSTDAENEYFSDGITEEIINALVRVDGLRVTSRTSSFAFKGRSEDIRSIGEQLGVSSLLEGSVRKAGNRIRVTAQLINTSDGYHVFSEVYDRNLEDIFEVQDELSRRIANLLRERFLGEDTPLVRRPTDNMEAYNLYLRGMHSWNQWSPQAVREGIRFFERAIELEPEFSLAYSGLASTHIYLGATGQLKPAIAYPKARDYAKRAIMLDDGLAESHCAIAEVRLFYDWNWDGAHEAYRRALELSPGSSLVHHSYSLYHIAMRDRKRMLEELELAASLDPLSPSIVHALSFAYIVNGQIAQAEQQYHTLLERHPNYRAAWESLGWAAMRRGDTQQAIEYFRKFQSLTSHPTHGRSGLGYALAIAGQREEAEQCLALLREREKMDPDVSLEIDFMILHAGLGNFDEAFAHLENAYEQRLGSLLFVLANPGWGALHRDPRFDALLERMGLPPMSDEEKNLIVPYSQE
ncbi:MAG: adenylate/guanylate cyclase domain-containing protein [Bacteroidota bacterium]|nr:adenylate/guanylate cyclase domain-containing protein [Bacteroidota bacterium]